MKRLLCIVGGMNAGGAETFLMKLYRNIDRNKYQMDFCVSKQEKGFYDDEITAMGGRIIHTIAKSKNPFASFKSLYTIIKENEYDYVMRVSQHSLSALELVIAKMAGAKVLVFRSSNSKTMKGGLEGILHKAFMFLPRIVPTVKIAPSIPAAEFMFGKNAVKKEKVIYLNNGIPIEKFLFNESSRKNIRSELGLSDNFLIGHIGRFCVQKNHEKLIDIFFNVRQKREDAHLILVGEGELELDIKRKVEEMGIKDRVHFLGVRRDIPELLSAMDVFVFPSLYEGMPNTVIEAQANGIHCVIADTITQEVKITNNVTMLSLDEDMKIWVDCILKENSRVKSTENQEKLFSQGYDISNVTEVFIKSVFEAKI